MSAPLPRQDGADAPLPLRGVLYISQSAEPVDLDALARHSATRNAREGLTGALLGYHGYYLQWLEGPGDVLQRCLDRIAKDPRHQRLRVLSDEPLARRLAPDWAMHQTQADRADRAVDAYLGSLADQPCSADEAAVARRFLLALAARSPMARA